MVLFPSSLDSCIERLGTLNTSVLDESRDALSLSVGSGARVFVAECDSLQACFEGVQMVAIETVMSETSSFPQGHFNISTLDHMKKLKSNAFVGDTGHFACLGGILKHGSREPQDSVFSTPEFHQGSTLYGGEVHGQLPGVPITGVSKLKETAAKSDLVFPVRVGVLIGKRSFRLHRWTRCHRIGYSRALRVRTLKG